MEVGRGFVQSGSKLRQYIAHAGKESLTMATNNQIVKASRAFEEAQEQLQALKDRKQVLQDQLNEVNASIANAQPQVVGLLAALKTLVNE